MIKTIISALIGIGIAYLLFYSPQFQKAFYPTEYWGHEVVNMAEIVAYDKFKITQTQQKIDLYQSDDLLVVQKIELEILAKELQLWKILLAADNKRLDLLIEESAK